tara:strand:- start:783 stop:1805 length:1023 start_codon:yes stop_codon:yes gene_type:complete
MRILITGIAGFIGFHVGKRLLEDGYFVIGIDNLNPYYDVTLKESRLEELNKIANSENGSLIFKKVDLEDQDKLNQIFLKLKPEKVIHLAAQAGVRYSIENPSSYIQSNIVGFGNILENCKELAIEHLVYASSSSVYGGNDSYPFSEKDRVDHPVSLYAATKKSNELMAHTYSHLFQLSTTGLRFFTVYGPWGRPDMALFKFTNAIINKLPIEIFNKGDMIRDFTYIDDIVESIILVLKKNAVPNLSFRDKDPNPATSWAPYRVFNIGNSTPINLMDYINCIETIIGIKAIKKFMPMQPGDVKKTLSDSTLLEEWINFKPKTSLEKGVTNFIEWYQEYYKA